MNSFPIFVKKNRNNSSIKTIDSSVLKILDEFARENKLDRKEGMTLVFSKHLKEIEPYNASVELLLNYISSAYGSLFYGSPLSIKENSGDYLLSPNGSGIVCCTNLGAAAIINALISKDKLSPPGMKIPLNMNPEQPFKVEIYGLSKKAVNESGFVYIVNNTEEFERMHPSLWQFKNTSGNPVRINARIPISNYDFKHPINDISNCRDIRLDVEIEKKY